MHQILIIVLSISAASACDQDQDQDDCDCDSLYTCVDTKLWNMQNEFSVCNQNCKRQFGSAADQIQMCFQNKRNRLAPYEDWIRKCMFNEQTGLCGSASASNQTTKQQYKQTNDNINDTNNANDTDNTTYTNDTNVQQREKVGTRCRVKRQGEIDYSFVQYKACMKQCFRNRNPEYKQSLLKPIRTAKGGKQRRRPRRNDTSLLKKCTLEQNCIISKENEMATAKSCRTQSGLTEELQLQIKKEFCECLSETFNVDPSDMQCDNTNNLEVESELIVVFQE